MTDDKTVAGRLARWVTELRFDDLPAEVVQRTKQLILDQIGVQVLGTTLPNVQPVRLAAAAVPGPPESTVTGGGRTSAAQAAYVNGTLGHSCEYDDAHGAAWHTASAVVPAALALAERDDVDSREVITAVAAGVQVMGLLGSVTTGAMVANGWHGSKVLGVFGATAAAGRVLGLTTTELREALGIAGSDASGTMEYDRSGGEVKRLHAGSAARAGVEAAQLARLGLTGPATIFEGHRGVFRLFAQTEAPIPDAAWERWQVLDTIFRFYPMVATVHAPLDAIRHLREVHAVDPTRIRRIRVGLVDFAVGHGAGITRPTDAISAQFSLAYGVGLQFVTGGNAPIDYFDPSRWYATEILAIGDLVDPYPMPIPAGDPVFSARVDIELSDGTSVGHYQAGFHGHTTRPASPADIEEKFRANVSGVLTADESRAVISAVESFDGRDGVRPIAEILRR
ncbi:2-methylcitrate dehydratase PrpD [Micromonospora pisi]|uniref:2-methylcitrate dehydratase PrpD n=1 Tax=Micromonospora pisi TaxID=589240 RepID=A0A495JX06_9ACTN|nr:MmgE/PrpD family protein [Micromonospora pisi]RKR92892.1 2-methylcitrate dehydratase PrpD [Micromonospora pisi]